METIIAFLSIIGAAAWWTTAFTTNKAGPFGIIIKTKMSITRLLNGSTLLNCNHCTSFWMTLLFASMWYGGNDTIKAGVTLFGLMGLTMAVRGLSQEF